MMSYDRKYLLWAFSYLIFGMCLGIFMAASHNHAQHPTHAHINLLGFVVSFIYGATHKLWLTGKIPGLAKIQFILHHASAVTIFACLLLLYGDVVPEAQLDPILAIASLNILVAALMMFIMVYKAHPIKEGMINPAIAG